VKLGQLIVDAADSLISCPHQLPASCGAVLGAPAPSPVPRQLGLAELSQADPDNAGISGNGVRAMEAMSKLTNQTDSAAIQRKYMEYIVDRGEGSKPQGSCLYGAPQPGFDGSAH